MAKECPFRQVNVSREYDDQPPYLCTAVEEGAEPVMIPLSFCEDCNVPERDKEVNCRYFEPYCKHNIGRQSGSFHWARCTHPQREKAIARKEDEDETQTICGQCSYKTPRSRY